MSYITQENALYVSTILQNFLKDRYQIDVATAVPDYNRLVTQTMNGIYQLYPNIRNNTDQLNKITISELKDKILQLVSQSPPPAPPQPPPPPERQQAPVTTEEEVPPEVAFVSKLQKLEHQRNSFVPPPPEKFDVKAAEAIYSHPQSSAAPVIPANIQTVYMPSPPRIGAELKVASWQRDWLNYPKRNGFVYAGSLPSRINITDVRLGCVILPSNVALRNPLLSIYIEAPNSQEHQISVLLEQIIGGFGIYKTVTHSLSLVYLLALPWKITVEASDGEAIDLGSDKVGFKVLRATPQLTTIEVEVSSFAQVGDSLRVYSDRKILPAIVVATREKELDITGSFTQNGYLLNFTQQVTLVLDCAKN